MTNDELFATAEVILPEGGKVHLLAIAGSKAYGTDHAGSDTDVRGMFVLPSSEFLGVRTPELNYELDDPDLNLKELAHFVRLINGGNPHVVETLWTNPEDIIHVSSTGLALLASRTEFVSQATLRAYGGYFTGQVNYLNRMDPEHRRYRKTQGHIVRLYKAIVHLVETGTVLVRMSDDDVDECRLWPDTVSKGDFLKWADLKVTIVERIVTMQAHKFPEPKGYDWLNEFVLALRYQAA